MSRSIERITAETPSHVPTGDVPQVPGKHRHYEIQADESGMHHHEKMLDADGGVIFDQAVTMDYVVGSGRRAKAYIYQRGSLLFMSPLNWYSRSGKWDLAPGYLPDDPRRFDRRVTDDCLSCHAGRVASEGRGQNRYERPPFFQASIGCENCHGPGAEHVAFHKDEPCAEAKDPIVNPSRLAEAERESVCYQCHLLAAARIPRYGRSEFDFRPGMRIEDVWTVLVNGPAESEHDQARAVSHVQQMRASRCYAESNGTFGCISCHDPHRVPSEPEKTAFYRNKCLACHDQHPCGLPPAERSRKNNDCVSCHMPARDPNNISHVSQTDHRILRKPSKQSPANPKPGDESLHFFDDMHRRLSQGEEDRALGLGAYVYLSKTGRPMPMSLIRTLDGLLEHEPDDGRILATLGAIALDHNELELARRYFERARTIPESQEAAYEGLMKIHYLSANWEDALKCADWLVPLDPGDYRANALRADALVHLGRLREGIAAAEKSLAYNPTLLEVRRLLVEWYRQSGEAQRGRDQETTLNRMENIIHP